MPFRTLRTVSKSYLADFRKSFSSGASLHPITPYPSSRAKDVLSHSEGVTSAFGAKSKEPLAVQCSRLLPPGVMFARLREHPPRTKNVHPHLSPSRAGTIKAPTYPLGVMLTNSPTPFCQKCRAMGCEGWPMLERPPNSGQYLAGNALNRRPSLGRGGWSLRPRASGRRFGWHTLGKSVCGNSLPCALADYKLYWQLTYL